LKHKLIKEEINTTSNKLATATEIPHGYPSDPIDMIHETVAYSPT